MKALLFYYRHYERYCDIYPSFLGAVRAAWGMEGYNSASPSAIVLENGEVHLRYDSKRWEEADEKYDRELTETAKAFVESSGPMYEVTAKYFTDAPSFQYDLTTDPDQAEESAKELRRFLPESRVHIKVKEGRG